MNKLEHKENFKVVAGSTEEPNNFHFRPKKTSSGFEVTDIPTHVDVELTNVCDLACEFCETLVMKRKQGMMSLETFKTVVDQCEAIGVRSIKLNLWGESLLNKQLCNMVDYAKQNTSLVLQFNTNANRLTPEIVRRLILAGLDRMTVSVDGITKETYEKLRVKGDYEKVFKNVHRMFELKKELGSTKPHIIMQIIRTTENIQEVEPFVEYWKDYADEVSVTNIGIVEDVNIMRFSVRGSTKKQARKPCQQPWQRISIHWDGAVTVCCRDYEGALSIGRIGQDSLLDLWRGDKLAAFRERHTKLDFQGLICNTCTDSMDFGNDQQ